MWKFSYTQHWKHPLKANNFSSNFEDKIKNICDFYEKASTSFGR
jgi:hypothetical protein